MSGYMDGDDQSTCFSKRLFDSALRLDAGDDDAASTTYKILAAKQDEIAKFGQGVADNKPNMTFKMDVPRTNNNERTSSPTNDFDNEHSQNHCTLESIYVRDNSSDSSCICTYSPMSKTLQEGSNNVMEPKLFVPSDDNENQSLVMIQNQGDQQSLCKKASATRLSFSTQIENNKGNITAEECKSPSYSIENAETPSCVQDRKIFSNAIVAEAHPRCLKEFDNEGESNSEQTDSEREKLALFHCVCDGTCPENCCADPLKCDTNAPALIRGSKHQIKQRACSSIRRIQEKLQGDLLQDVHRDQHLSGRENKMFCKSPKPTSSSALYHMRRQRSRSRASKYGKTASHLTQRPYRRWLGVSTNIFSDARYIVSSKRRSNPSDVAGGKSDDQVISQQQIDQSVGRQSGKFAATTKSPKQRGQTEEDSRASSSSGKQENDRMREKMCLKPQAEMCSSIDERNQHELGQSESRKNEKIAIDEFSRQRNVHLANRYTNETYEARSLFDKQESDRMVEEPLVQPRTEKSPFIENCKNNETDELQLEENCFLQCCNDSEHRISMSSPFLDVTSTLNKKRQQDKMEKDAFLESESQQPFNLSFGVSSCADMEGQCITRSKIIETSIKRNEHNVDNGSLSSDIKSPGTGSEEVKLYTDTKDLHGKLTFHFSGQCTPEPFSESLTSDLSGKISLSPKTGKKRKCRRKQCPSPNLQHNSQIIQGSKSPQIAAVYESTEVNSKLRDHVSISTSDPKDSFRQDGGLAGNVISIPQYEFITKPPNVSEAAAKSRLLQAVAFDGTNGINPLREELKQYLDLGLHPTRTKPNELSAIRKFMKRSPQRAEGKNRQYYNVQATKNFHGKLPGQLSFEKGQIIKQLDTGLLPKNGMSFGYYRVGRLRKKKSGLYPCSHVTCQVEDSD